MTDALQHLWPEELACLLRFHKDRERDDREMGYGVAADAEAARIAQLRAAMNYLRPRWRRCRDEQCRTYRQCRATPLPCSAP